MGRNARASGLLKFRRLVAASLGGANARDHPRGKEPSPCRTACTIYDDRHPVHRPSVLSWPRYRDRYSGDESLKQCREHCNRGCICMYLLPSVIHFLLQKVVQRCGMRKVHLSRQRRHGLGLETSPIRTNLWIKSYPDVQLRKGATLVDSAGTDSGFKRKLSSDKDLVSFKYNDILRYSSCANGPTCRTAQARIRAPPCASGGASPPPCPSLQHATHTCVVFFYCSACCA